MNTKLRCLLVYRLESHDGHHGTGATIPVLLASFHAQDDMAKIGSRVTSNAPPIIPLNHNHMLGGFTVRRSGDAQLVYCADADRICYCVVTGLGYHDRLAMLCLAELAREFKQALGHLAIDAEENSLSCAGRGVLGAIYSKYDDVKKVRMIFRRKKIAKETGQDQVAPRKGDTSEQGVEDTEFTQMVSAFKKKKTSSREKAKRVRFAHIAAKDTEKQGTNSLAKKRHLESRKCSANKESLLRAADDVAGEKFISSLLLGGSLMVMSTVTTRSVGIEENTNVEGDKSTRSFEMTELSHEDMPISTIRDDQHEGQDRGDNASPPASLGDTTFSETQDEIIGHSTSENDIPCPTGRNVASSGRGCISEEFNLLTAEDFEEIDTRSSDSSFVEFLPFESMPCLFPYDMPSGLSFCGYSVTSSGATTAKAESIGDACQPNSHSATRSSCGEDESICETSTLEGDQTSVLAHQNRILRKMTLQLSAENKILREACKGWEVKYEELSRKVDGSDSRLSFESSSAEDPATLGTTDASQRTLRLDSVTPKTTKDEDEASASSPFQQPLALGVESKATPLEQIPAVPFPYSMEEIIEQLGELDNDDSLSRSEDELTAFQPRRKRHDKKPTPPMRRPAAVPNFITI